jgi:cell division protein FtsZ
MADDVLHNGVRSVTDLMIMPGLINLDYADIKAVMSEMGKAMMGTGEASGDNRAVESAERAIANPLLEHHSMKGAKGVLINITGGPDMTLFEVDAAANRIREEVGDGEANIIFGSTFNPELEGIMRVSVVATGIDADMVISIRSEAEKNIAATLEKKTIEPIIQKEEVVAMEEIHITTSEVKQENNESSELPPRFGEYNMPSSHGTSTYTPPFPQEQSSQNDSGPLALLRKMWGMTSIKPVPSTTEKEPQTSYDEQPLAQEKEQVGEMYEIPAFLRRK